MDSRLWLFYENAGWAVCLCFTWVCHWEPCIKQPLFEIRSLRGWKKSFQAGSSFICQRGVDSLCWKVPFQAFRLITFPFLLSLKLWLLDWNAFRGTSCGVCQLCVSNILWWLGKRFAYRVSWVGWEFGIWRLLIRPYLGNGSGGMAMKPLICGKGHSHEIWGGKRGLVH